LVITDIAMPELNGLDMILELTRQYGVEPLTVATYVFVGIFFAALAVGEVHFPLRNGAFITMAACIFSALAPFVFLTGGLSRDGIASIYPAAAAAVFAFGYIAIPMAMLVDIQQEFAGRFYLIFLMFVVWSGDIFAYFVGKSIGRYKMAPRISPKKTWEGSIAGFASSIVVAFAFMRWLSVPIVILLGAAAVGNVAGQIGDLLESAYKRSAGVKDSGALLPGHGGMLDRIDALILAIPVVWYYFVLLYPPTV